MSSPHGHVSPAEWAGDQLTALSVTLRNFGLVNWLLFITCFVASYQAKVEFEKISKPDHQDILILILKCVASLIPALILLLSARNKDNYRTGLLKGREDTTREWQLAVRGQFNALRGLANLLEQPSKPKRESEGRLAVRELIVSTRKIVVSVFDGIEEDALTVSIGVPNSAKTKMKIVELTPATATRQDGNEYDVDPNPDLQHSMIRSLTTGLPSNTPDAHQHADLRGKSYRSILSLPIKDANNYQVAVLNIDGPDVGMFGDSVGIGSETSLAATAYELSQPNLKALAITISQAELYKAYRQS